ncbi:MAG: PQQ-binding-like beta-propeller repeat protein, partial [Planctomycetales bacterium]|nr:PQQ-binding-like beta-propeller repeat protein [Planctomycetales bacterium]
WFVSERTWWLADEALWVALVVVAAMGAIWSSARRIGETTPDGQRVVKTPVSVEFVALAMLLVVGACWTSYLWFSGSFPIDQMTVVSAAAVAAIGHLVVRRVRCGVAGTRVAWFTTELVFLWCLAVGGTAVGMFVNAREGNKQAEAVVADWPAFRGSVARLGTTRVDDPGLAARPIVLWSFDPRERKGRVRFHSSPTVVDGQLYIGAMHEVSTLIEGYVYCVNTRDGAHAAGASAASAIPGERLWQFSAGGTLKPVFSSPTVSGGRVFIGEGYHQDTGCRLFCLDARNGDHVHWSLTTTSHVESSATIANENVIFGAGDDGLICFEASIAKADTSSQPPPLKWIVKNLHVDASPAVADGRVFVGTVVGDVHRETLVLAVDAVTGAELWRTPTPLAVPGSPAVADGRVFVGLGNGKVDHDADDPAGAVWCLDAKSGEKLWEFRTANAVLSTPAVSGGRVFACSRDEQCHCLNADDGKVVWSTSLGGPIVASPVVAGDRVYVVTTSGVVVGLDAATGSEVWRFDELDVPDADVYASPTLDDGRLYVAAGGRVYCLGKK